MTDIVLFDDRILIKRDPLAEKTSGGIYIPNSAKGNEPKMTATVVLAGEGHVAPETGVLIPMAVKAGDRISLSTYVASHQITIDGEDLLLIRQPDIDMIIQEETVIN
jgi:chaperonin GroES